MGETEKELYRAMSKSEFERRKSHLEQSLGSEEQPSLAEVDASGSIGSFAVASEDPHPGTGRFGRVLFVRHRKFGHMALAKVFDGQSSAEDELAVLEKYAGLTNSVGVMQMLEHGPQWAVFPFYPATLKAHLQEVGPLPQSMCVATASQVASGCLCLAKLGYFHGDIKPGNIMLDPAHMWAVLANFVLTVPTSKPGVEASRYTGPYRGGDQSDRELDCCVRLPRSCQRAGVVPQPPGDWDLLQICREKGRREAHEGVLRQAPRRAGANSRALPATPAAEAGGSPLHRWFFWTDCLGRFDTAVRGERYFRRGIQSCALPGPACFADFVNRLPRMFDPQGKNAQRGLFCLQSETDRAKLFSTAFGRASKVMRCAAARWSAARWLGARRLRVGLGEVEGGICLSEVGIFLRRTG